MAEEKKDQQQVQGKTSTQRAAEARQAGDKETAQKEMQSQHSTSSQAGDFGVKTDDDVELVNSEATTRDQIQRDFLDDEESRFVRDEDDNVAGVRGPDQLSPPQQYDAEDLEERYNPEGREMNPHTGYSQTEEQFLHQSAKKNNK